MKYKFILVIAFVTSFNLTAQNIKQENSLMLEQVYKAYKMDDYINVIPIKNMDRNIEHWYQSDWELYKRYEKVFDYIIDKNEKLVFGINACQKAFDDKNYRKAIKYNYISERDYKYITDQQKNLMLDLIEKLKPYEKIIEFEDKKKKEEAIKIIGKDSIKYITEEMPKFPGGEDGLRKFIANNVKYPVEAQKLNQQGRIYISFVVTGEGLVDSVKVALGIYPLLDLEALRVVRSMPKWEPGLQDGKPVNVSYTIPINFVSQLNNEY